MRPTFLVFALSLAASVAVSPALAAETPQLLILDLQRGPEFDAAIGRTLTDLVTIEAGKEKSITAVSGAELRSLAKLEGEKALAGCDVNSCLAEIAGALGARFVLTGRVSTIGAIKVLQMSVFDATTAAAISREAIQAEEVGQFVIRIPDAVRALLAPMRALLNAEAAAAKLAAEAKAKIDAEANVDNTNTVATVTPTSAPSSTSPSSTSPSSTSPSSTSPSSTSPSAPATAAAPASPAAAIPSAPPESSSAEGASPYATRDDDAETVDDEGGISGFALGGVAVAGLGAVTLVASGLAAVIGGAVFLTPEPGEPLLKRWVGGGVATGGVVVGTLAVGAALGGAAMVIGGLSE